MPQRLLAPELRHALRMRSQAPHFRGPGRAARLRLGRHPGPRGRQLRRAQADTGLFARLAKPHLLGPLGRLVKIHRAAPEPLGPPQLAPAADRGGRPLVALRVHKGLHRRQRMPPALLPVRRQPREQELHKTAHQIGIMAFRQHQPPRVVGQKRPPGAPLLRRPADELIARLEMKSRRAPRRQRQPLPAMADDVAQMLPHQRGRMQIMMFLDQLIEPVLLGAVRHQPHRPMFQNVLFRRRGPAKTSFNFCQAGKFGKFFRPGPAFGCNSPNRNGARMWKIAP